MFARYLRWYSQSPDGVLHQVADWPDYEAPAGVGDGEPASAGGEPAQPAGGGQPAAGQPAAAAREPGQPAAQPGGQPAGQPGGGQPRAGELPAYRVEQINERRALQTRLDTLEGENKRFRDALSQALGLGSAQPADPRTARLRETLFTIVPELKDLVEKLHPKAAEILGLADAAPQWTESQKNYWQGVAVRTQETLHAGVARLLLGDGKTAADLDPELRDDVRDAFIRWCERDTTGQRVQRYESQDRTLVDDFLKGFSARYLDPVRRSAAMSIGARGGRVAQLPQAGGSALPAAAQPARVNNQDEDAVHGRAWQVLQQLRGS